MTRFTATRQALTTACIALAAATAVTGCRSPWSHSPRPGTVAGMLLRVGGPAPGAPVPLPGHVTATPVGGGPHYTFPVARNGRYRIHLAPGSYRLTGTSPQIQSGHQTCSAPHLVQVRSGQVTVGVKIFCSIH